VTSNDDSAALLERVKESTKTKIPLRIVGGDSKKHLGNTNTGRASTEVSTLGHSGIISYDPTELVVTVRAGTLLSELNNALSEAGQMLPFEPPEFVGSTIGGVLACGLSGPRRPFSGSARDYVLGMRVINGHAQDLSFGGQVMKNVAGYDVSRTQVGAWGTLGLLLDTSMKVLPCPEKELTLCQESSEHDAGAFAAFLRQALPLSGAMLVGTRRYFRLSGSESAVMAAAKELGGEEVSDAASVWASVRDHTHEFFSQESHALAEGETLWRISVADYATAINIDGEWLYEWAGAQRWLKSKMSAKAVFEAAAKAGGHAIRYGASTAMDSFQPLPGPMCRLQARVRDSFDPNRVFNRGRFHPEMDSAFSTDNQTTD
jgi:glycolate oxidase FAD binding subunit